MAKKIFLVASLLVFSSCMRRQFSTNEFFTEFISNDPTIHVNGLQVDYHPEHEWWAWLHFSSTQENFERIRSALGLDQQSSYKLESRNISKAFSGAPKNFQPPSASSGEEVSYSGFKPKTAVYSVIVYDRSTGEIFLSMQQQ